MRIPLGIAFSYTMAFIACSTIGTTNATQPRYAQDYISPKEIQNADANTAYDLVRQLRPHWLKGRGIKSLHRNQASYPVVYVNSSRHGDVYSLSTISANHIAEIRFFNAGDAALEYGLDHAAGAILVSL